MTLSDSALTSHGQCQPRLTAQLEFLDCSLPELGDLADLMTLCSVLADLMTLCNVFTDLSGS